MKFKDLLELFCTEMEHRDIDFMRKIIVEGMARDDNTIIVLGTDGEFHYLYSEPYKEEKEKLFYWASRFEDGGFDRTLELEIPEGYWVYEYQTLVNFYEFRYFKEFNAAKEHFDSEKFGKDELLVEKAIFYIDENKKECILFERDKD